MNTSIPISSSHKMYDVAAFFYFCHAFTDYIKHVGG